MKQHRYKIRNTWTGNIGLGTYDYKSYERAYTISVEGKPDLSGSSDPSFRGDRSRHNPEELFLASIASCHMLWFLHLCSVEGVVVSAYEDVATGTMVEKKDGSGRFTEVILKPVVTVSSAEMIPKAETLHARANEMCFIANSCNFPIRHQPQTQIVF
mgnify:CR=1 FL=1